jgi:hypothetical protein
VTSFESLRNAAAAAAQKYVTTQMEAGVPLSWLGFRVSCGNGVWVDVMPQYHPKLREGVDVRWRPNNWPANSDDTNEKTEAWLDGFCCEVKSILRKDVGERLARGEDLNWTSVDVRYGRQGGFRAAREPGDSGRLG